VPALSVRMPDAEFDESAIAAQVAKAIGLRHEVVECSPHAAADLEMLIERLGVPFADSSLLPTYWVCQAVAGHAKVALSGDGGDELFYGYDRTRAADVLARWGFLLRLVPAGWLDRRRPGGASQRLARLVEAARGDGWTELTALFGASDRRAVFGGGLGAGAEDAFHAAVRTTEDARMWDVANYLPDDLLRKVDTASLAAGVEVRCPFLHPGLAARALATPRLTHTRGGERKHLLRELVRTLLPAREAALVADRPKQGFAVPISRWFREDFGGLRGLLLERLTGPEPFGAVHGVLPVDGGAVRRMIDEHWAAGGLAPVAGTRNPRPRDHGQRLYGLLVLALWARTVQI
jgi:asparagine synthase (glutamine-hydrolysing)